MIDKKQQKVTKGQATSRKILKAAQELFYKHGYQNTTVADISSKAGVAVGTFYLYYKDKYTIYETVLSNYQRQIRDYIHETIKHATTRKEKEKLGLRAWLKFVASNHHVYRIIWESLFVEPELFRNYYIKFGNAYADALKRDNILEGEDIDLKTVAFMLMGVSNFIGLHTLFDGKYDDETIDKICDDAIKVLDKGLF
ncbi:MAG: TetR/AcrR family transcriptional regulator [Bacilli bacterium]